MNKAKRHEEDIKRELSVIITELKDPRIAPFTSVVRLNLAPDLSYCKAYISSLGSIKDDDSLKVAKESCEGLKSAEGYIKRELLHRLKLRRAPSFEFVATDSIEYSAKISQKLQSLTYFTNDENEEES